MVEVEEVEEPVEVEEPAEVEPVEAELAEEEPAEVEEVVVVEVEEEEPVEEVVEEPEEVVIVEKSDSSDHEPTEYVNPSVTERNVLKVHVDQLLKQVKSPGQAPIDRYQDERSREEELTELCA